MPSKTMHKRLIAAVNLLAKFAEQNLPNGYLISLNFSSNEATMDLTEPVGFDVDVLSADAGHSQFAEACAVAQEIENTRDE